MNKWWQSCNSSAVCDTTFLRTIQVQVISHRWGHSDLLQNGNCWTLTIVFLPKKWYKSWLFKLARSIAVDDDPSQYKSLCCRVYIVYALAAFFALCLATRLPTPNTFLSLFFFSLICFLDPSLFFSSPTWNFLSEMRRIVIHKPSIGIAAWYRNDRSYIKSERSLTNKMMVFSGYKDIAHNGNVLKNLLLQVYILARIF